MIKFFKNYFTGTLVLSKKDFDYDIITESKEALLQMGFEYIGEDTIEAMDITMYEFKRDSVECRIQCEIYCNTELIGPQSVIKEYKQFIQNRKTKD